MLKWLRQIREVVSLPQPYESYMKPSVCEEGNAHVAWGPIILLGHTCKCAGKTTHGAGWEEERPAPP